MIPSETPPVRRVSSTTRTRCVATASRAMSSIGSGASQRRSTTRASIAALLEAAGDPQRHQEAVAPGEDRQVVAVAVRACRAERDVLGARRREPEAVALLVAGRACGRARSARGRRRRCRRPSQRRRTCAASRRHRPAAPATRSRARECRAGRRPSRRCGSGRRSPSGSRTRRSARPCRCGTGPARRTAASPPRRGAGPRRCGDTRGTGSRAAARSR